MPLAVYTGLVGHASASAPRRETALKTIGLIGGMSWESTLPSYRRLNDLAHERLGELHVRAVVDFALAEEPGR